MKVLQVFQKGVEIGGLTSTEPRFNKRTSVVFLIFGLCVTSQCAYIFQTAHGFIEYTDCVYKTGTTISILVCYGSLVFHKTELFAFIDGIERIANERNQDPKSEILYDEVNEKIERWSKIVFFLSVIVSPFCFIFPNIIFSFYAFYTTDLKNDALILLVPMWFPFNWHNPIGFLWAALIQYLMFVYIFFFIACSSTLAIAVYLFTTTATNDIQEKLHSVNETVERADEQSDISFEITNYIEYHSILKQSFADVSIISQPKILVLFTWSIVLLCGCMLILQMSHQERNNFLLLITIFEAFYSIFVVFAVCELSQRASDSFTGIYDIVDALDWYLFPVEMQKLFPIIIMNAQKPATLECFGSILSDRITFKNVVNTSFSYFMVLRRFNN